MNHRYIIPVVAAILAGCGQSESPALDSEPQRAPKASSNTSVAGDGANALKLDDIFPRDRLLEVDIQVADDDWDTLRHQSRNFFEALQPKH